MGTLKIGIIKEGKIPPDKRVPLSPSQCKEILDRYPSVEIKVQSSPIRKYKDEEYTTLGVPVVDSIADCDVIMGVKEVQISDLIENKRFFFFSHTIKEQPYNRDLLLAILDKNIELVDWETLTQPNGVRLIGFGRYAGIVGCYNGLLAYGKRFGLYNLKPANQCEDRAEMEREYSKVDLPNIKILITGGGRVAKGAIEVLEGIGIKKVSAQEYLTQEFDEPVYAQIFSSDYYKKKDGGEFVKSEFYETPQLYESDFKKWSQQTDFYVPCHYWDSESDFLFTREEAKAEDFKIKVVADISCDIDGPVACTIRPSSIADPIYGYDVVSETECDPMQEGSITVMAVDNLPCELPKDASEDFGREFIDNILPHLVGEDQDDIIERATITRNRELTSHYSYLQDYVDGVEA